MKPNLDAPAHFPAVLLGCQDPDEHQAFELLTIKQSQGTLRKILSVLSMAEM